MDFLAVEIVQKVETPTYFSLFVQQLQIHSECSNSIVASCVAKHREDNRFQRNLTSRWPPIPQKVAARKINVKIPKLFSRQQLDTFKPQLRTTGLFFQHFLIPKTRLSRLTITDRYASRLTNQHDEGGPFVHHDDLNPENLNLDDTQADKLSGASSAEDEQRDAFARLFAKHDRWLFSYLVTLLSSPASAEEVFQEVCVVLWREHETFELGTDFVKWVAVIAHNQVRKFRRQHKRSVYQLSDEAYEHVAAAAIERANLFDSRREALSDCLGKLTSEDRHLVQLCYDDSAMSIKSTADRLGRPVNTVYKALNRIRRVLHECIDRNLATEGLA